MRITSYPLSLGRFTIHNVIEVLGVHSENYGDGRTSPCLSYLSREDGDPDLLLFDVELECLHLYSAIAAGAGGIPPRFIGSAPDHSRTRYENDGVMRYAPSSDVVMVFLRNMLPLPREE
jgi:hypothetical protein